jgi:hypothetical protein
LSKGKRLDEWDALPDSPITNQIGWFCSFIALIRSSSAVVRFCGSAIETSSSDSLDAEATQLVAIDDIIDANIKLVNFVTTLQAMMKVWNGQA